MSNGFSPDADNKEMQWWIKYPPQRSSHTFTINEVCRGLGITRWTVRYWIKKGALENVWNEAHTRRFITRKSVEAFLATHPERCAKVAARA